MKRITEIALENYRAFFGDYESIQLEKGENLLVYGENGSGKSSFYKAFSNFFSSSRNSTLQFQKNHFQTLEPGFIRFGFHDFDSITRKRNASLGEYITFGSELTDTDSSDFVKLTELVKGFLDYRRLLEVYLHKEAKPNLFQLIVIDLLENFIPPGGTYALGKKWTEFYHDARNVYTRRERKHQRVLAELPAFEATLRTSLDSIFLRVNGFLMKYFKLNLRLGYVLKPLLPYNYVLNDWHPTADLRLEIHLNGISVTNQADILNEARLAAVSICLYLAALLRNPQVLEYKILYLDDVFVGLDTGNRIPILEILKDHFTEYQIFISTYDRHWFELAKHYFDIHNPGRWSALEFYVGEGRVGGKSFDKPLLVASESDYNKGVQYLHHRSKPDYPAAANYFRKTLEQLLQQFIPIWELAGDENIQIPEYKLGTICMKAKRFFEKTNNTLDSFSKIHALLPALLHPFSHHNITAPIYKKELTIIETEILAVKKQLTDLNISNNYRCSILAGHNRVRIRYVIDASTRHYSFYDLRTLEPIVLINKPGTALDISGVKCVMEKCWGERNGAEVAGSRLVFTNEQKATAAFNFGSLSNAYDQIYSRIIRYPQVGTFVKDADYIANMQFKDFSGVYQPLATAISWI